MIDRQISKWAASLLILMMSHRSLIFCESIWTSEYYRKPLFVSNSPRVDTTNPYRISERGFNKAHSSKASSTFPFSEENFSGKTEEPYHYQHFKSDVSHNRRHQVYHEPNSWGNLHSDNNNSSPQFPLETNNGRPHLYPCSELEIALKNALADFNHAVDYKQHLLTEVESGKFREDASTLSSVIRSEFYRETENLIRKSGRRVMGCNAATYQTAIKSALENLVAHRQDHSWYKRLRIFIGAESFHAILNSVTEVGFN